MQPLIREQVGADAEGVRSLLLAAFVNESGVAELEAALAARSDSSGYVADADGELVGHVRLTRGWVDARERLVEALVLSPLSVAPERQRNGIGRALVDHALRVADEVGAPAVFLEGDPAYYRRLGWAPASSIGVTPPSDRIPEDACQVRLLRAYEPWMRGRLVYADAFWQTDTVGLRET